MSGRKLESWIKQPLTDLSQISQSTHTIRNIAKVVQLDAPRSFFGLFLFSDRRLDYVEMFTSSPEVRANMYDQALKKVHKRAHTRARAATEERTR